jgi:hypothetical protein
MKPKQQMKLKWKDFRSILVSFKKGLETMKAFLTLKESNLVLRVL